MYDGSRHVFLSGRNVDVINGADHYHSLWIDPPSWAADIQPVIDIGNHRFYKLREFA